MAACDNIRIGRCNLYKCEEYCGKFTSKRSYFYSTKVHMIATIDREPVEGVLLQDVIMMALFLNSFELNLPTLARLNENR